jgi:excinuclease ABC subunit A
MIVDFGPKAGIYGGEIVATGTVKDIINSNRSLTGDYLAGRKSIPIPKVRIPAEQGYLSIKGAKHNNLKDIDVDIPLGLFVCVTGVSGSGKSSLINQTLYPYLHNYFYHTSHKVGKVDTIEGIENIDKIISIDQQPIGRTPRSNPSTYVRYLILFGCYLVSYQNLKCEVTVQGRFSFNVKGGRCEACEGAGVKQIEMHFMPDIYVTCEACKGKRYNQETLSIRYKGKNIAEVLDMDVQEAYEFFQNIPAIRNKLQTLMEVGLDYIKLGQPSTTLSGGEAQRIKLSRELSKVSTGKLCIYWMNLLQVFILMI